MNGSIRETLETPIRQECDVLVAGGGMAGVSAALAAARVGAKTILIDRNYLLGGLATAGLVTIFLPLCDGMGHQVSFGIAEELLRLSVSLGAEEEPPAVWMESGPPEKRREHRFMARYNAQLFAILLEKLLRESGVSILYGVSVVALKQTGRHVEAAILESKSGREGILARSFVDATGDADLFSLAGAPTRTYAAGNPLAAWYYRLSRKELELRTLGAADVPEMLRTQRSVPEQLSKRRFEGLTAAELSEMVMLAREKTLEDLLASRAWDADSVPVTLPTIPQVRMTRCIVGAYTLDDTRNNCSFADEIGRVADWRRSGFVYGVPLRALYGAHARNLIAAGRCISVDDGMWDVSRVIPACCVTGEAAGTAAALSDDFAAMDPNALRSVLIKQGALRA